MGADTTSTHLIFFIAATVVATAAAGILSGVTTNLVEKASIRGASFGEELASEIRIVNDPAQVVASPNTIFYIKNTGSTTLDLETITVVLDGQVVSVTSSLLGGETTFRPGAVAELTYASALGAGDHRVQIVMSNGAKDEMKFRV